jgi:peptide/nickel transport system permease protein
VHVQVADLSTPSVVARRPSGQPHELRRFLLRRILTLLVTLWLASVLVFLVLNILPGKPAQVILGTQATPSSVAALTAKLGLNRPLVDQYLHWIHGLVTLNLGNSYISAQPIAPVIGAALEVTGPLVLAGLVVGLLIAIPLGIASALRHTRRSGIVLSGIAQIGIAIPNFVLGILLIIVFAVDLKVLPASGFTTWSTSVTGALQSLVLPAVALGLVEGAILARYIRASIIEVLRADYLRTARAKGLWPNQALIRHGLRNASIPVLTVFGLELSGLIIGAVVIEAVFTLPGLGSLLLSSVANRDLITVQDIVMLVATTVLVVNTIVDILYRVIDPRMGLRS